MPSIKIISCATGSGLTLPYAPSQTLSSLKSSLLQSPSYASSRAVRLFYLGRELKTGGRTLDGLGVGRFNVWVMHALGDAKGGGEWEKEANRGKKAQQQPAKKQGAKRKVS
mmetsp:Transcript_25522/g.50936  ORF Transcript_25522/g.50936 Transcript_25522/m.50936 type:complete len:111 (-) Transcript_25522:149-481(-)